MKHTKLYSFIILIGISLVFLKGSIYADSIHNPENGPFVTEVAFNQGINQNAVSQSMFDARYINPYK